MFSILIRAPNANRYALKLSSGPSRHLMSGGPLNDAVLDRHIPCWTFRVESKQMEHIGDRDFGRQILSGVDHSAHAAKTRDQLIQ